MPETSSGISTVDPGGPPLDLPAWEGAPPTPPRTRVEITVPRKADKVDPFANEPTEAPQAKPSPPLVAGADPFANEPTEAPERKEPPQFTRAEAAGEGLLNMFSFGASPVLGGLANVAGPEWRQEDLYGPQGNPIAPIVGAYKMAANWASSHPDPAIRDAYEKGRQAGQEYHEEAYRQQPAAYIAGMAAGAPLTPAFGALKAAGMGGRILQGMKAGGLGGLAYGVGSSAGEGLSTDDMIRRSVMTSGLGALTGGALTGALGPRLVDTASPGYRAARTAESLIDPTTGRPTPLPSGMTSPSPFVQSAAARAQMVPFAGTRMKEAVGATQRAAGQEVTDIAEQALGGQGAAAQSAAAGRAQNALYNKVWPNIDPNVQYSMPRTQAAISKVKARRQEANWADPGQGLDKFERAAQGSTARGAHMTHSEERAKIADYDAGKATPNAGYARGDWNTILGAMREDTRHMIGGAAFQKATGQGYTRQQAQIAAGRTVADYDAAQSQFGRLAGRRRFLTKLENRVGSDANVLYQLGRNDATGRFSLDKFVTEWNKMPQRRRDQLFDKGHQDAIKEIVDMGEHIKGALRDVNTSHTAGALLTFDLAKDAVMLTLAAGSHLAGSGLEHAMEPSLMGTGGATASIATALMFHWMARPDIARSLSSWTKAYRSLYKEQTPIRRAAFMAATRNLSKNINVPVENLIRQGHAWATGQYPDHPEVE